MAKRSPLGEAPYRPLLDSDVLSGALKMAAPGAAPRPQFTPSARAEITKPVELQKQGSPREQSSGASEVRPLFIAPVAGAEMVEKLDNERRLLLTRAESMALDRLVASMAGRLKTQVKSSHVLRGLVALILNAETEIDQRAGEVGSLIRPPNGDGKALQRFEREIGKILGAAIRDAGPLR